MNTNVMFLVAAVVLSAVGALVVWLFSRPRRPKGSSVEQFSRHLDALSPERRGVRPPSAMPRHTMNGRDDDLRGRRTGTGA